MTMKSTEPLEDQLSLANHTRLTDCKHFPPGSVRLSISWKIDFMLRLDGVILLILMKWVQYPNHDISRSFSCSGVAGVVFSRMSSPQDDEEKDEMSEYESVTPHSVGVVAALSRGCSSSDHQGAVIRGSYRSRWGSGRSQEAGSGREPVTEERWRRQCSFCRWWTVVH
ncbi:hypothetical protein INR49_009437 [Caranx melampygus]|nr:hypothetical protein INR49_009437 [Caranx melampygus]